MGSAQGSAQPSFLCSLFGFCFVGVWCVVLGLGLGFSGVVVLRVGSGAGVVLVRSGQSELGRSLGTCLLFISTTIMQYKVLNIKHLRTQ